MAKLLTTAEVAEQLRVTDGTVRKWVAAKRIPYVKLGSAVRFEQSSIDNWINKRTIKARIAGVTI